LITSSYGRSYTCFCFNSRCNYETVVIAPNHKHKTKTVELYSIKGEDLINKYTPAVGAITTVFSSLIGLFQQDIKKVIAYSTMSQLGMMVIAPNHKHKTKTVELYSIKGEDLINKYTPAVTIVAVY
jgi:beta-galactosidase GanA